jgi:hypothetical protein
MKKFVEFFDILTEANVRTIPKSVPLQANKIADMYLDLVKKIKPKDLNKLKLAGMRADWKSYFEDNGDNVWYTFTLTTVKFKNLKTDKMTTFTVYVAFGENNPNYAICDNNNKIIVLYDDNCRDIPKDKLISTIVHEITHGIQQHKEYSEKYKKLANQKTPGAKQAANSMYHKEPIEFDAFTTEIAHTITTEFYKIKNSIANSKMTETKKIMERKLEKFLLEFKLFIQSPLDTYFIHKELTLPASLNSFEEMLSSIHENSKLWKSFKTKMLNLYKQLITIK